MNNHIETADILDGAADVIEKRGWIQNNFETPHGVCMTEAAYCAGAQIGEYAWVTAFMRTTDMVPIDFNDAPGRTRQEVLDALRLAAKNERIAADLGGDAA